MNAASSIRLWLLVTLMAPTVCAPQVVEPAEPLQELSGVVLSLLIVVGVILGAAWLLRRTPFAATSRKSGPLRLVATLPLGPKERLLLVEADGCEVLLGVSPAGIFPLSRIVTDAGAPERRSDAIEALTPSMSVPSWLGERQ